MNQQEVEAYNRREIRAITKAFKAMDETATSEAKRVAGDLAEYALGKIQEAARGRTKATKVAVRIADQGKVSKTSKIGEMSFGFANQKLSGGATTRDVWAGMEFGSIKWRQFPARTPRFKKGNYGYFIFPTLRAAQPHIIAEWQDAFSKILKEW